MLKFCQAQFVFIVVQQGVIFNLISFCKLCDKYGNEGYCYGLLSFVFEDGRSCLLDILSLCESHVLYYAG